MVSGNTTYKGEYNKPTPTCGSSCTPTYNANFSYEVTNTPIIRFVINIFLQTILGHRLQNGMRKVKRVLDQILFYICHMCNLVYREALYKSLFPPLYGVQIVQGREM